jgi:transcriptional regulator with XRE-family HTH domain
MYGMPDTGTLALVMAGDLLLGKAIRDAREASGMSQPQLAAELGISQTAVSKMELGQIAITSSRLREVAAALKTTVSLLMDESTEAPLRDRLAHAPQLLPRHRQNLVELYDLYEREAGS